MVAVVGSWHTLVTEGMVGGHGGSGPSVKGAEGAEVPAADLHVAVMVYEASGSRPAADQGPLCV